MTQLENAVRTFALVAALTVPGCSTAVPPTAPDAVTVADGGAPPAAATTSVRWTGVGHRVAGSVTFSAQNGVGRLDFSADFSVDDLPGPFVYVNTTNNANTGKPLRVSALKSVSGAQSYTFQLPAGTPYSWVLLWCDPYNVAIAEAAVPASP